MRTVHFELLRPPEIVAERERLPLVFLPIGPLEWHSVHLPLGTDGLNAGEVARRTAERVGGVVLPTFFWGTERERKPGQARDLGFQEDDYVVGMDFPKNMMKSLYCREEYLAVLVRELLTLLVQQGYKLIVIVNGHGALNHVETLDRLRAEFTATSPARVLLTMALATEGGRFEYGYGHADVIETSLMMALHPDSVDMSDLPDPSEPLQTYDWAIVDEDTFRGRPQPDFTLPRHADPRLHSTPEQGHQALENAVVEVEKTVREALRELGY